MSRAIKFKCKGDLKSTTKFLEAVRSNGLSDILNRYGQKGVEALQEATPKRTGKTAASWFYEIERDDKSICITWNNSNISKGINIALLIQNGHATGSGYYVEGIDYINPALAPIFDEIASGMWEEVSKSG